MVELVRPGRPPEELAHEFGPTAPSIWSWVKQWERDAGKCADGASSAEKEELAQLRHKNHWLRQKREIWQRRRIRVGI